ncbi:MAG: hypothetical protein JKX74_01220 [Flavobacteriales bacterium]|nr:hypothetical protein [Flavobacteriales bacterium]
MSFILKYAPAFFQRLDNYLRVNHPWLWSTRIHITMYLALILSGVFALVGWAYGLDIRDLPTLGDSEGFFSLLIIPTVIFMVFTVYHMALYNSDKSYGRKFLYQEFFVFFIYTLSFILPFVIPYSAQLMVDHRIADLVDDEELHLDHKNYDYGRMYFPDDSYDYDYYPSDSIYIDEYHRKALGFVGGTEAELAAYQEWQQELYQMHREWENMKDSIYQHEGVFLHERPYLYLDRRYFRKAEYYYVDERKDLWEIEDSLLEEFVYQRNIDRDIAYATEGIANVVRLMDQYSYVSDIKADLDEQTILEDYRAHNYKWSFSEKYLGPNLHKARGNMNRIAEAKNFDGYMYDGFWFMFMFVFLYYCAIFFNVFKNVHWKQFLLGLVVIGAGWAVFGIIDVMYNFRGDLMMSSLMILLGLCFWQSFRAFSATRYTVWMNQAVVLLNFLLPVVPFAILGFMDVVLDFFHWEYFDQYREMKFYYGEWHWDYTDEYHIVVEAIRLITFWAGILIYPFVWNTYVKILYLRLWALPSNK